MFLTVRYLGIVVHSSELEAGKEYRIGRARDNDIVADVSMMSRHQGKIYSENGNWFFAPYGKTSTPPVRLELSQPISMRDQLEIMVSESEPEEATKSSTIDQIQKVLASSHGRLNRLSYGLSFFLCALVFGGFGGYKYYESSRPMDAKTLLPFVRSKIVEFELPEKSKMVEDLRKYAKFEDKDFSDTLGFCTGFIMEKNIILTANHCIQGTGIASPAGKFVIKTSDGKKHQVKRVLGFNAKRDYAYLEMEGMESYGHLEFSDAYSIGDKVFTVGNAHGQGVAIREGILANETPDRNDPNVKFLRYSAAASPGNSGGPLVDPYGRVVSLVFAKVNQGENYNLGTTTSDLKDGFKSYVNDRSTKKVVTNTKDLLIYHPQYLLSSLNLPAQDSWYDNPEYSEPLNEIQFEVSVPADMTSFYREATEKANAATREVYNSVIAKMAKDGKVLTSWDSWASGDVKAVVPSQFQSSYYGINMTTDMTQVVESTAFMKPPSEFFKKSFMKTFKKGFYDFTPSVQTGELVSNENKSGKKISNFKSGELHFSTADAERKNTLSMFTYRTGLEVRKVFKVKDGNWMSAREFPSDLLLSRLVGREGVLVSSASTYVRPNSTKDFTVKALDEDVVKTQITDTLGRVWNLSHFKVFDQITEFYCLPSVQGSACLVKGRKAGEESIISAARQNYVDYYLSQVLVQPEFARLDATQDYIAKGFAETNPMMKDFALEESKDGGLKVSLKTLGVEFRLPKNEKPTAIRLNGGYLASAGKWVAFSFDTIHKESGKSRVCGRGVEMVSSPSASVLSKENQHVELYKKYNSKTKPRYFAKNFKTSAVKGEDFRAYGYCWKVAKKEKKDEFMNATLSNLEKKKVTFKVFEPKLIAH